jgi:hypothetical protein
MHWFLFEKYVPYKPQSIPRMLYRFSKCSCEMLRRLVKCALVCLERTRLAAAP